jgi:hypothetical protein
VPPGDSLKATAAQGKVYAPGQVGRARRQLYSSQIFLIPQGVTDSSALDHHISLKHEARNWRARRQHDSNLSEQG